MVDHYKIIRPLLFMLPAETAHNLAVWALSKNLWPSKGLSDDMLRSKMLGQRIFGLDFKNPVGLAAGFDKNAECLNALSGQGFGFIEVGTVTPIPQAGNPKPRLFRIREKLAVVNRMGFNNKGIELYSQKLRLWKYSGFGQREVLVGANIGKNKNSPNDSSDYLKCLEKVYGLCDYVVINISSPNTPGLRDMQGKDELTKLITDIKAKKKEIKTKYKGKMPILIKISPDENDERLEDIAKIVIKKKINGVIISNTTTKTNLLGREVMEKKLAEKKLVGGISGKPVFELSNQVIERFYRFTGGKVRIIGVGGISSAADAYTKIRKGASLVQVYSALIYEGFGLVSEINNGLVELLKRDGFANISEAIGADVKLDDKITG